MSRYLLSQPAAHCAQTPQMVEARAYYSTNLWLHVKFWVKEHAEIMDYRGWWYDVGSDENVFVDRQDFSEVWCRPKPHHLCFVGVQLKVLRHAPVVHIHHYTSSKPCSDVTNVGRPAVLDALHVVSKQMVDTMLLENVGDILCVGDEGLRSKLRSLTCAYLQFTDTWWVCADYNNLCLISIVGGEPVIVGGEPVEHCFVGAAFSTFTTSSHVTGLKCVSGSDWEFGDVRCECIDGRRTYPFHLILEMMGLDCYGLLKIFWVTLTNSIALFK